MSEFSNSNPSESRDQEKIRNILRMSLAPDAMQRLNNLRLVKPELVGQIELELANLISAGKIKPPISDAQIKILLLDLQKKRETKISWR